MRKLLNICGAFLLLLLLGLQPAGAQTETGQISGTVTDQSGAVVPDAKVTARSVATNVARTTTTNSSGIYAFASLPPAPYVVSVEAAGFAAWQRQVTVEVGGRVGLDAQLQVGQTATSIEVAVSEVLVNTETQTISTTVNSKQILELPTLSRDPYALVTTSANVSGNTPDGRGVGFAINGQRASSTNVLLDGTANNDEFGAGVGQRIPLDSVQEFSILTNNFTPEFGRATGGIVNVVTKSGTNNLHGTLYEFNRLSHLASNDFNSNANGIDRPVFTRNQFGYSLGGPVVKNKLFAFSSTEWTRIRSIANNTAYVPTQQFLALADSHTQAFFNTYGAMAPGVTVLGNYTKTDLAARGVNLCSGLSAASRCASVPASTPVFQRVNFTVPADSGGGAPQNTYSTVNRVDYYLNDKTQMFVRYALSSESDFPGAVSSSPYDGYNTPNTQYNNSVVYSLTRMFTPRFVQQTKVDFNRFNNQQPFSSKYAAVPTLYTTPNGATTLPGGTIEFPGYVPTSPGNGIPFGGPQNFLQLYEDLSWTKGRHQLRFGGSYNYLRDNRTFGAYQTAGEYLSTSLPKAMENFLAGQLYQLQVAINPAGKYPCGATVTADCTVTMPVGAPNFSRSNRYNDYALYFQDSWKLTQRLTVNLGLRWEVFGTQHNKNGNLDSNYYPSSSSDFFTSIAGGGLQNAPASPIGKLWNTNYGNVGPRVGIAYDLFGDGKTSLRGGYSRAYERNFGNVTFNVIQNPPNYQTVSIVSGVDFAQIPISVENLGPFAGGVGSKALPKATLRAVNPNIQTAYADLYSVSLEHKLSDRILGAVEYSGSHGSNQYGITNVNRIGFGNFYLGVPCKPGTDGDPGNCTARIRSTQYGSINFRTNGGTSNYNAMTVRFDVRGKYGLNMRGNYTWSHATDDLSDTFSSSVPNLGWLDPLHPGLDKGNAYFDVRHRLVIAGTWDVGMNKSSGWHKQVLGGWALAPILSISSGAPFGIYDCTNAYNMCPYAFATTAVPTSGYTPVATATPNTYNILDMSKYFSSAWYDPKTGISDVGTFPSSMVGRNTFRGPGSWNLDMGVYKNFFLGEKYRLQFRAEGYNFFNHPNLLNPGYQDFSNGNFVTTGYGGRRFVQMALKFSF